MKTLLLLSITLLAGCSTSPAKNLNQSWPNLDWQKHAYKKSDELPRTSDERLFCKNGLTQENWTHLLAAMAKNESSFKPKLEYKESFSTGGKPVISTGLFQVSTGSANNVYGLNVTQEDLYDPHKNTDVAVHILKHWTERDGVVANHVGRTWRGGARYWSVLRHEKYDKKQKKWVKNPAYQRVMDYVKGFCQ